MHFQISSQTTSGGYKLNSYFVSLPFTFIIKKYKNITERIFIEKNYYFKYYDKDIQQFIESHLDIPLKSVNDIEAFDYIQNWSKYYSCKNYHSQFTFMINYLDSFGLRDFPVDYKDLINDYEFEDNQIKRIVYYINKPSINKIKSVLNEEIEKYISKAMINYNYFITPPRTENQ